MEYQKGSGILSNISTLTLPLGLAKLATIEPKNNDKKEDNKGKNVSNLNKSKSIKNSYGGAFAENILIEAGLSVVPFALISSLEYFDENDKKTCEKTKQNQ